ncbi:MAG: ABC transporter permease, partial [Rhodobacteraceae bacterium]
MSLADQAPVTLPTVDIEEQQRARREKINRIAKWTLPSLVLVLSVLGWHLYVTLAEVPHYILPGPV